MAQRKPLMAGNWKMNKVMGDGLELINGLKNNLAGVTQCEVLVCPPFTMLVPAAIALKGTEIKWGAQNMHWEAKGAYTGEISASMLTDIGCTYVIIGHSERRQFFGETDDSVNKKMKAALGAGIIPIVCVGETLAEREQNITFSVIDRQVKNGVAGLTAQQAETIVIAYEPVWAIGTGKTATPQQAQEVHAYIRGLYKKMYGTAADAVRILYGGSVKADNVRILMDQADIDGALVGGASLEVDSFTKIARF